MPTWPGRGGCSSSKSTSRRRGAPRDAGVAAAGDGPGPRAVRHPDGPGLSFGQVWLAEFPPARVRARPRLHPRFSRRPEDVAQRCPSRSARTTLRDGREDPAAAGPDPGAGRQRLCRGQPVADAARPSARTYTAPRLAKPAWRLEGLPAENVRAVDLLIDSNLDALLDLIRPRTIFDCVAYGAYSFETDSQLIYRTNFQFVTRLLPRLQARVDRMLRACRQFIGVRRQGRRAGGERTRSLPIATTPSRRSPLPI